MNAETPAAGRDAENVLEVTDLGVDFWVDGEFYPAAKDLNYVVKRGEVLAIVGESGSGKSSSSMALLGLLPPNARVTGSIKLLGQELQGIPEDQLRQVRGNQIAVIFQEPMTALNPVYTVGFQITEALRTHFDLPLATARARAVELLKMVDIPNPEASFHKYPHQLSGGMRQRVMIAMALACKPKLLIADEPTTALDVTVQAQILDLLRELQEETGMSIILITHDLGVVAEMADEVAVMYAGRVVERAPAGALFGDPMHPYTLGLLGSVPRLDEDRETLLAIDGSVPPPFALPKGCRFHPRCPFAAPECRSDQPPLREVVSGHAAACLRAPVEAFAA